MQLRLTHETCYDYVPAVSYAQHMAYLQPLNTPWQQLQSHTLQITPEPAHRNATLDVYGNARLFFSLQTAHTQLKVVARSIVTTQPPTMAPSNQPWEQVRDAMQYRPARPYDAAVEFVFASPHVPQHPEFLDYAAPSFPPGQSLLLGARNLMQRIHTDILYASQSTQVNTPALIALQQRKGVCQDFAHIMIACLRALGLPARYVSGYLLTQTPTGQPRLVGSDASHAWVSVYLPDLYQTAPSGHWHDFDPTNNRDGWGTPGEDYVTLALGRDFADVSPMRGVIHGGTNHLLTVGVTVEPVEMTPFMGQSQSQGAII
jgi:transglutaminase-like putative cysteine protease